MILNFNITIYVCVPHFDDLSALVGRWSSVSIMRMIYKILNLFPFDYTALAVSGKVVNRFNHTSGVTAVTPTDRPKSVRNRCAIEVFGGVFYVVTLLFGFFCGCRGFCHRTESDLFLFLFLHYKGTFFFGNCEKNVFLTQNQICLKGRTKTILNWRV